MYQAIGMKSESGRLKNTSVIGFFCIFVKVKVSLSKLGGFWLILMLNNFKVMFKIVFLRFLNHYIIMRLWLKIRTTLRNT